MSYGCSVWPRRSPIGNLSSIDQLGFEERLGSPVEREASERQSRLIFATLRRAKLCFPDAVAEDIDCRTARGLDRALLGRLLTGE